ncbi:SH3 domain-containing protein [Rhodophyticola porphyridii]|uniref:SH3 domain-containing protein n=1 Tax=Rhodophyticola porphyridii TaxID=1852017 RepID=UPI001B1E8CAD|nr:hypothetical protein [Roseicyclus sp.]MBO6625508.1 hypothetical protein [Roseicyclus sp.]MBO6921440.1 hypothetical protein [Roseicyclus sp.]
MRTISRIALLAMALAVATPGVAQDTAPTPRPEVEITGVIATATPRTGAVTGFPIPRYVSLKAGEANARRGPSRSHRIDWVFQRRNMPMMVVAEYGHWRRVVDRDGAGGWMHYSLLSGVRTAIVESDMLQMHQRPDPASPVRAQAELGVVARLEECNGEWCRISTGGHWGWVPVSALWGVEPGEIVD